MAWHFETDNFINDNWIGKPAGFTGLPAQLYCGTPMPAEQEIKQEPEQLTGLTRQFCTSAVPWYYNNNTSKKDNDAIWQTGEDVFLPALWRTGIIVAYSEKGYLSKKWKLPADWNKVKSITVSSIPAEPVNDQVVLPVVRGEITLTLKAGDAVTIQANK